MRVVFDSLSELRLLARDSLRYRRQILGFKHFFTHHRSTVLLLDDRTGEDSDQQLRSLAHGVLLLEQLALDYGAERRKLRVVKMRGVLYRGGYHDYTIRTGGLEVFPRLVAAEHHTPFERSTVLSGVRELDTLLGGGLDSGTSSLIMGPAGCGKTVLATQYACAAASRGDHVAFYLFDERLGTFIDRADRLGMPIEKYQREGKIFIRSIDPAEVSPGEFAHTIVDTTKREGSKFVVIDSLNGYINAMPDERLLDIRLHELLSYLAQRGVTTLLTLAQHGLFASSSSQAEVSYLADSLLVLRFFEAMGEVRKAISVLKKRSGPHELTIREFQVTNRGVRVGEPLREFQGVLTGVPDYVGQRQPLSPRRDPAPVAVMRRTAGRVRRADSPSGAHRPRCRAAVPRLSHKTASRRASAPIWARSPRRSKPAARSPSSRKKRCTAPRPISSTRRSPRNPPGPTSRSSSSSAAAPPWPRAERCSPALPDTAM